MILKEIKYYYIKMDIIFIIILKQMVENSNKLSGLLTDEYLLETMKVDFLKKYFYVKWNKR